MTSAAARGIGAIGGWDMHRAMAGMVVALGVLAAALAFLLGASAWAADAAPTPSGPIRIGAFLSLTGSAAWLGEPEDKTLRLYAAQMNAAGGVQHRTLDLVIYDDGGDANKARTFGKRLIDEDKVDLLIGGTTTATTMAVVPLVEEAHVPFLSLAGAAVIVDPDRAYIEGWLDELGVRELWGKLTKELG